MATIYKADGSVEETKQVSLQDLQKHVGGYIELVRLPDHRHMYVNEDGFMKELAPNSIASSLARKPILGDAVVFTKEETEADTDRGD